MCVLCVLCPPLHTSTRRHLAPKHGHTPQAYTHARTHACGRAPYEYACPKSMPENSRGSTPRPCVCKGHTPHSPLTHTTTQTQTQTYQNRHSPPACPESRPLPPLPFSLSQPPPSPPYLREAGQPVEDSRRQGAQLIAVQIEVPAGATRGGQRQSSYMPRRACLHPCVNGAPCGPPTHTDTQTHPRTKARTHATGIHSRAHTRMRSCRI
jgi:hypothetical protein